VEWNTGERKEIVIVQLEIDIFHFLLKDN
jgi:hypothetical protein